MKKIVGMLHLEMVQELEWKEEDFPCVEEIRGLIEQAFQGWKETLQEEIDKVNTFHDRANADRPQWRGPTVLVFPVEEGETR